MEEKPHCDLSLFGQIHDKAINAVNIGIFVLDPEGCIVLWNRWMEDKSGYKRNDVIGHFLESVFQEIINPRFCSAIKQAIDNGSTSVLAQSIHKSPLPLFNEGKSKRLAQAIEILPLKIPSQSSFHCLVKITDVGSAINREAQLRNHAKELSEVVRDLSDSENRAQTIIDSSGDGVIIADENGLIISFSSRAEKILGYKEEEVLNQGVAQFLPPAYAEQVPTFTRMLSRHGGLMQVGLWRLLEAKHKDGSIFPVKLNLTTVKVAGKTQIIGVVRDLSELEASERALQESNDSLEMALDNGELWMWDCHLETGDDVMYHDRMIKILGYDQEKITSDSLTWECLVHPDDWPEVDIKMREHLNGKTTDFDCEYRLLMASGEWLWVHDRGTVVSRDQEGNALRVIGINQNISRRKHAEIEAVKASKEALEAARAKTAFLGNMSHELRTPMNGIMGVLNLLKYSDATEEQLEYIEVAKRSAESLLKLIDNVLDFTKLGAQSVQLELLAFDPNEILKDVVKLLSDSAEQKGITLDYQIEDDTIGSITTDPGRLRQVLLNLVANAIKFTHEGYVKIRLLKIENDVLLFEVEDSGIGIPEDRQHLIFDAFTQADVSTTRKYGGTGLGLGISKELVELMGGQIMVTSEDAKGSVFSFTIKSHEQLEVINQEDEKEFV